MFPFAKDEISAIAESSIVSFFYANASSSAATIETEWPGLAIFKLQTGSLIILITENQNFMHKYEKSIPAASECFCPLFTC